MLMLTGLERCQIEEDKFEPPVQFVTVLCQLPRQVRFTSMAPLVVAAQARAATSSGSISPVSITSGLATTTVQQDRDEPNNSPYVHMSSGAPLRSKVI